MLPIIQNILLTKEDIILYAQQQRETEAKKYGLTLAEWDNAIINQLPVTCSSSTTF